MMLEGKTALVWGGSGAIGAAISDRFARSGAHVVTAARTEARLDAAKASSAYRHRISTVVADATDVDAVRTVTASIARERGLDIVVNMIGDDHEQGRSWEDNSLDDLLVPLRRNLVPQVSTALAAARHLRRGGVIMTVSTTAAINADPGSGGLAMASAAVETLTRQVAQAVGGRGIRCLCLRPNGMPDAVRAGSHSARVFETAAERHGHTLEQMLDTFPGGTILHRSPSLDDVAAAAEFFASDSAAAFTGTVERIGPSGSTLAL